MSAGMMEAIAKTNRARLEFSAVEHVIADRQEAVLQQITGLLSKGQPDLQQLLVLCTELKVYRDLLSSARAGFEKLMG